MAFRVGHKTNLGRICSKETRKKISKSHLGKRLTKEHREKMSLANKGKKLSKEAKDKISKSLRGKKCYWYGKNLSEEHKNKISIGNLRKKPWNKGLGNKCSNNEKQRKCLQFRLWREAVFARDNWICQKCRVRGGTLHPHHIRNFAEVIELRFILGNGIALCKKCHNAFHKKYGLKNNTIRQLKMFGVVSRYYEQNLQ